MTGKRKIFICLTAIASLILLGSLAGALELSDGVVESIASALAWITIGFAGGNGLEHIGQGLAKRITPTPR